MQSYQRARLNLTAWYVFFVMILSAAFSYATYRYLTLELSRTIEAQSFKLYSRFGMVLPPEQLVDIYEDANSRIIFNLLILNTGIFFISAFGSYFIAGKTLDPLEKNTQEQKRFIADASHELKTPLTSMKTEIEVALRNKRLGIRESKNLISSNLEEIEKMRSLVNSLLLLSQSESPQISITKSHILIGNIFEILEKNITPQAKSKNILLRFSGKEVDLVSDEKRLVEVMTILLDNAIKYSHTGGEIIITAQKIAKEVQITVRDYGIGIDSTILPHIFDRFYRGESSRTKAEREGFGLGLSIAKSIVHSLKGSIHVASSVGKGSTFTIKIPTKI